MGAAGDELEEGVEFDVAVDEGALEEEVPEH